MKQAYKIFKVGKNTVSGVFEAGQLKFFGGWLAITSALMPTFATATPAVFFDSDLTAGRNNFSTLVASTPGTPTVYTLNLATATATNNIYTVTSGSSTTYVKINFQGSYLNQSAFSSSTGTNGYSVSITSSGVSAWTEAVNEGMTFEFYSDAAATTAVQMNAIGAEVNDWGTCCTSGNVDNNGATENATSVYAVFDANVGASPTGSDSRISQIGAISSSSQRGTFAGTYAGGGTNTNNHFVAAVNDTNNFSSVTIVPNGDGEFFGIGGLIYFSQVQLNSVPAGSSVVTVGNTATSSTRDINQSGDTVTNLVALGGSVLNSVFDGGELLVDRNLSTSDVASFSIKTGAGNAQLNAASGQTFAVGSQFTNNGSSAGVLEKVGTGTLRLTNTTNDYSGGTVISAGTLEIASDSVLGASSGGVTLNGGTLATTADISSGRAVSLGSSNGTVDTASATTLTLSGVVSGSGALTKTGAGNLSVTGNNTYTGATTVSAGTLDLDGSLASVVTVASGARIEGTGNGGGLTASGTVAPGNSPGTLSFAGDVTFTSGNTFITELDGLTYDANGGAGTYDRLAVTGATSTFTAGGAITPILRGISAPANNTLDPVIGDAFRVVTTANASGVSGAFSTVTDPTSGMPTNTRFDVLYGGNYVDLVLTPDDLGTFAQAYSTQNMVNAANALDMVRPSQGTNGTTDKDQFFNGLYGLTASQVAQALLQASGEIHAFALSDARDGWQNGVGVVRSASQDADRNYWMDVSGYDLAVDQDSIASSYDGTTKRLWIGTDVYQAEAYVLGVAVGVSNSDITTVDTGSAETKTTSLAVYMKGSQGSFEYDGIFSVNRSEIDTTRTVDLRTGALTNTSSSTARGAALTAQVGYRYDIEDGNLSSLVWLRGDVDTTKADGFVEDGSTVTALTVREQDMRSTDVSLGYTVSGEIPNNDQPAGTWNLGIGASKTIDRGMPYVSRTMSMHGATWNVSVPQSGDVAKFASAGIDLPLGDDASMWLDIAATERDRSLSKSAAFGFQVQW